MLKHNLLVLLVLSTACETSKQPNQQASIVGDTIEIPAIAGAAALPAAQITEKLRDSILAVARPGEVGLDLRSSALAVMMRTGFVVADHHQLLFFDSDAQPIGRRGGLGEGPGEYRNIRALCETIGDTLVVFDANLRRVSILSPDGTYVRAFSIGIGAVPSRNGCLEDGSFVASRYKSREQQAVYRYNLAGAVADSSLVLNFDYTLGGFQVLVFPTFAVFKDSILIGNPWEGVIRIHNKHGETNRTLKLVGLRPGPIPDDLAYVWAQSGDQISRPAKRKNFPYFEQVRVTEDGAFWYNDFPRNTHEAARWYSLNRDGKRTGTLELDSSVVVNRSVVLEDFGTASVLLRIEHETRGAIFRIVPLANLRRQ